MRKDEVFRLFRDSVDEVTQETFDKLLELIVQIQSIRLNITGNRECLSLPQENHKLGENDENQEKPILMKDVGNLRLQILDELMNMKSLFLSEVKIFKNEFLQSFVKHIPSEKVHANTSSETLERLTNHLSRRAMSFRRKQFRNKDKIISSLTDQLSKNSDVIQTPIIYLQDKNLFPGTSEENTTPVKQKLSHNAETTNSTDLVTSVIKISNADFTMEKVQRNRNRSIK